MQDRAKKTWDILRERIANASAAYCPPSPHSKDPNVLNFINGQPISVSEDKNAQVELVEALAKGNYAANIIQREDMPATAMRLFIDGHITREQISTLLEIRQASALGKLTFFPIFDPKNPKVFSPEAKWYLYPFLTYTAKQQTTLNEEQFQYFKALMGETPLSEQYFYILPEPADKENQLRKTLVEYDGIILHQSTVNHLVCLSTSGKNARLIAMSGIENAMGHVTIIGKKTVDQILIGAKHDLRYGDVDYPGIKLYDAIHHYKPEEYSHLYNTAHDYDHAQVGSLTPRHYRHALLRMAEIIGQFCREQGVNGCKARWDLIDQEYCYFLHKRRYNKNIPYDTALFCEFLDYGGGGTILSQSSAHIFQPNSFTRQHQIHEVYTNIGILVMFDMCKNPEAWLKLGINPLELTGDYKNLYEKVKRIYHIIKDDPEHLRIFKVVNTFTLKSREQCEAMCIIISTQDVKAELIKNNKLRQLNFKFNMRLDNLNVHGLLNIIKSKFIDAIQDTELKAKMTGFANLIARSEMLFVVEKARRNRGYFAMFVNYFDSDVVITDLKDKISVLKANIQELADQPCRSLLEFAIEKTQLWQETAPSIVLANPCKIIK